MELYITEKDLQHFWSRVDKRSDSECWTHRNRSKLFRNYHKPGTITIDGIQMPVYRFSYYLQYGPIPEDAKVVHTCNNSLCVNPHHLQLISIDNGRPIPPR